jgi:hypothetical protein
MTFPTGSLTVPRTPDVSARTAGQNEQRHDLHTYFPHLAHDYLLCGSPQPRLSGLTRWDARWSIFDATLTLALMFRVKSLSDTLLAYGIPPGKQI